MRIFSNGWDLELSWLANGTVNLIIHSGPCQESFLSPELGTEPSALPEALNIVSKDS